jgi:hypothetical protein
VSVVRHSGTDATDVQLISAVPSQASIATGHGGFSAVYRANWGHNSFLRNTTDPYARGQCDLRDIDGAVCLVEVLLKHQVSLVKSDMHRYVV